MHFSVSELWSSIGIFAKTILCVMVLMSLSSVYVTCERLVVFIRSRKASRLYAEKMEMAFEGGLLESAGGAQDVGHLGRVIEAGIKAYQTSPDTNEEFTLDTVARALERQAQREVQELRRGQGVLATISSTAPFVGLLGTVMGIVTAFQQMAASGSGGLGTVSAGISEALVTTAVGLLVAIPAVFAFNFLQSWVEARSVDIAESSNEFLDLISRRMRREALSTMAK